jgi:hypothetical protein
MSQSQLEGGRNNLLQYNKAVVCGFSPSKLEHKVIRARQYVLGVAAATVKTKPLSAKLELGPL